jgi:hypothetical protein
MQGTDAASTFLSTASDNHSNPFESWNPFDEPMFTRSDPTVFELFRPPEPASPQPTLHSPLVSVSCFDVAWPYLPLITPAPVPDLVTAFQSRVLIFNPKEIGFIPSRIWIDRSVPFSAVVADFFQRKNCFNCRFSHKLFNALRLVEWRPACEVLVGVSWLTTSILRVNKMVFARLLGIRCIDGSLFHQQGNFPSHGFVEIGAGDVKKMCPGINLAGVDFEKIRIVFHQDGVFRQGCTEAQIENCKWTSAKPPGDRKGTNGRQ